MILKGKFRMMGMEIFEWFRREICECYQKFYEGIFGRVSDRFSEGISDVFRKQNDLKRDSIKNF